MLDFVDGELRCSVGEINRVTDVCVVPSARP